MLILSAGSSVTSALPAASREFASEVLATGV